MKKFLAVLIAALLASVPAVYALGFANADDVFIDIYVMLHATLGDFAVLLPVLCGVLAVAALVLGWRADGARAFVWPEQETPDTDVPLPESQPADDWLYQPVTDADDHFGRYFSEELMAGPDTAAEKKKKRVYARLGENFSTYFGEGRPSLGPVTRTVRVHGFHRYFNDTEYLISKRKKRAEAKKRTNAWGDMMSTYQRHEDELRRRGEILSRVEQAQKSAPSAPRRSASPPTNGYVSPPPGEHAAVPAAGVISPPAEAGFVSPPVEAGNTEVGEMPARRTENPNDTEWDNGAWDGIGAAAWEDGTDGSWDKPDGTARDEDGAERDAALPARPPFAASYVPEQYSGAPREVTRQNWTLPSAALLDKPVAERARPDIVEPERLEEIFAEYGVSVIVNHVTVGPVVTRYEVVPQSGTKIRKIESLADDVALALASSGGVRIEMIPGRGALGVEVPNPIADTVYFHQIVQSPIFTEKKSLLRVALGKGIADKPIVEELNRMPHLLVAGATGSGKSIFINCLINSILFSATPDEARLMLI
ncbi:MAG: hypothetical protein LBQ16_06175, partial [Gracilibacteraceae bacterium]|nr:hypothetical protein [Gracilibacteraceae bacterium]